MSDDDLEIEVDGERHESALEKPRVNVDATEMELKQAKEIMKRISRVRGAISRTEGFANILDDKRIDPLLGAFVPEFGDIITAGASLYIVGEGIVAGLPATKILKMLWNVGLDVSIGLIPILGDIYDWFKKANVENVAIMKRYADELEKRQSSRK